MSAKTALITGATSGIGAATAKYFAKNGIHLILCGRRQERLTTLKEKLENHAKWVTVISEKENDFQNLEFVKMLTTIPCCSFESYQDFESSLVGKVLQLKNGN